VSKTKKTKKTPKVKRQRRAVPLQTQHQSVDQYMDCDYWHLLDDEVKAWRNKFDKEYYLDSGTYKKDAIHNTDELRKAARVIKKQRDKEILTEYSDELDSVSTPDPLDALIEAYDRKKSSDS
jgi:hypothetical protein